MENQIQKDVLRVQQLAQTPIPISTPPSTKRSRILLFTVLGLIVITGLVFAGIQIGEKQTSSKQSTTIQPTMSPTKTKTDQMTIAGVIRTSGLSEDEKQKLGLSNVTYQLTDFNKKDKQDIYGYYLISSDKTIESLLGKCVQITGTEPTEWKSKNKNDSYLRTAFVPNNIGLVESSKCSPWSLL